MMLKKSPRIGILHYSAPPVVGGVENVILAHVRVFDESDVPVTVIAGRGERNAFPGGTELILIPELDSQHPHINAMNQMLEQGLIPSDFENMVHRIAAQLTSVLSSIDVLIVHNVFTKHFNLPLTAALFRLIDAGTIHHCIAWCHDSTWTSPRSRSKVHHGYPWDLLRTYRSDVSYVTVSQERQRELSELFGCSPEQVGVIYNGVDAGELLALSDEGLALINRLDLWDSDLSLIMPVRVTRAKNIELALRVIAAIKAKGIRPKLVVTGPPDPHDPMNMEYFQSLLALREQLDVELEARFVYETGPVSNEPFSVNMSIVSEVLRVSDALFMPSHREGFGMPILEAGLLGLVVFSADSVPAAKEIGGQDVIQFSPEADPHQVAELILASTQHNSLLQFRRRVRQGFTWQSIFRRQILPLLYEASHETSEQR